MTKTKLLSWLLLLCLLLPPDDPIRIEREPEILDRLVRSRPYGES